LRSTFIVGFPGETEEDFQILLDWLDEAKLDRVGAFKYEPVTGAAANDLGLPQVPEEVKQIRWRRFMEKQQKISAARQKAKVGKRLPVIIDKVFAGGGEGRTKADAPEIDGKVLLASRRPLRVGDIVTVKIDRAEAYDLHGAVV
jgi:ribosomal protein S12 methylthiotransferase